MTLAPGVTNDLDDLVFTGTNNPETQVVNRGLISVNGARSTQNTFTVDGADVTDRGSNLTIQAYPSVDSIGEFKVLRSLYPAESGRSGGGQINVITRGGGEKFHGSGFEFVRNEKLNANDFQTNRTPSLATVLGTDSNGKIKRRPFRYNNYGFTVGGPIVLPKLYDGHDKSFFFFNLEQFRENQNITNQPITVVHSDDGGTTWSSPVVVNTGAFIRNVQITTGPDGTVFIAGMNEGTGGLGSRTNLIYRSTDGGQGWQAITVGAAFPGPGQSTCGYFAAMFPSYWRYMGWGDIGVGPGGVVSYAYTAHGSGSVRGATRTGRSARTPRGSRDVIRTVTLSHAATSSATCAPAGRTCSKLSRTSRISRSCR